MLSALGGPARAQQPQTQRSEVNRLESSVADLHVRADHVQRLATDAQLLLSRMSQLTAATSVAHGEGVPAAPISQGTEGQLQQQYVQAATQFAATLNAALDERDLELFYRKLLDGLWYRGLKTESGATLRAAATAGMVNDTEFEQGFREQGIEIEEAARRGLTLLNMESEGKRWREAGYTPIAGMPDAASADVVMEAVVMPTSPPPWQEMSLGPVNQHRFVSLLTQSAPPVVYALAAEVIPQAMQKLTPGESAGAAPTPAPLTAISGWCCHDGRLYGGVEEACCRSIGGWHAVGRSEAKARCNVMGKEDHGEPGESYDPDRPGDPHEPGEPGGEGHGWCCLHGEVMPAPEHDCMQHGGRFFMRPDEAEMHCRPEEDWNAGEPHEPGEPYDPDRPRDPHEPGEPGGEEHDWCCLDGRVFPGVDSTCCRSLAGSPFADEHAAREHCERGANEW